MACCFWMWLTAFFFGLRLFSVEQKVDSERSSAWILGIVFSCCLLQGLPRFLSRIPSQTRPNVRRLRTRPHGNLQRASLRSLQVSHIPDTATEIRAIARTCRPSSVLHPTLFFFRHPYLPICALRLNTNLFGLVPSRICVFSWGVYPFSIMLLADLVQVISVSVTRAPSDTDVPDSGRWVGLTCG